MIVMCCSGSNLMWVYNIYNRRGRGGAKAAVGGRGAGTRRQWLAAGARMFENTGRLIVRVHAWCHIAPLVVLCCLLLLHFASPPHSPSGALAQRTFAALSRDCALPAASFLFL